MTNTQTKTPHQRPHGKGIQPAPAGSVFSRRRKQGAGKFGGKKPQTPLSKSVGAVVVNRKLQVLLVFQAKNQYWEFPKGKMEAGEDEVATLKREINEETGIRKFRLVNDFRTVMYYTFRHEGKTIRRAVVYYLIQTTDPILISDEHSNFLWLSIPEVKKKLKHRNQIKLLEEVEKKIYGK